MNNNFFEYDIFIEGKLIDLAVLNEELVEMTNYKSIVQIVLSHQK